MEDRNTGETKGLVLVLDDEEVVLNMLGRFLETYQFQTLLAQDGETALRLYSENKSEITHLIFDYSLCEEGPYRNGAEVYHRIRKTHSDFSAKTIFMSGYAEEEFFQDLKLIDSNTNFLEKPFSLEPLRKVFNLTLPETEQ